MWIRVYPDDVHVDVHETQLTAVERAAGEEYWRQVWAAGPDRGRRAAAWARLLDRLGSGRATWVVEQLRPDGSPPTQMTPHGAVPPDPGPFRDLPSREDTWTRPARTMLLPNQLEFTAYSGERVAWRRQGLPIPPDLALGMAPPPAAEPQEDPATDGLPWDVASRWLVDFDEAERVGMGLKVKLADAQQQFDLLTVVGVNTCDAAEGARRFAGALQAHACTDGLAILPTGTPTNNTRASRSGWRSDSTPLSPLERDAQLSRYDFAGTQDASRAERALGLGPRSPLAVSRDALGGDEDTLAILHAVLARQLNLTTFDVAHPAGGGWEVAGPLLDFPGAHFAAFVRSRGPLPTLRIGRQPYGLVPASTLDRLGSLQHLPSFVSNFRRELQKVPRVGEGTDQDAVLLDILTRRPVSDRVRCARMGTPWRPGGEPEMPRIGSMPGDCGYAWMDPPAAPASLPELPAPDLTAVADLAAKRPLGKYGELLQGLDALLDVADGVVPAALDTLEPEAQELNAVLRSLAESMAVGVFYRFAAPVVGLAFSRGVELHRLLSSAAAPERVAPARKAYWDARKSAGQVISLETADREGIARLERLTFEVLDTVSHRTDAWVTSVATSDLARLRAQRPTGLHIGGYGWITDLKRADETSGGEYVMTPSLHHATTAAVLRSGFDGHADPRALAVRLTSSRVRRALDVLGGVRAGQRLGALLGYQLERGMHDAGLDEFIDDLREAYPLPQEVDPTETGSQEARTALAARNVVDGEALRNDGAALAPAALGGDVAFRALVADLEDTVDAVADLQLAESVHQLVGGSAARAGAAADVTGRGENIPDDYDVVATPRSGAAVTHQLGLLTRRDAEADSGWPQARALTALEPGLEQWCRHRLGAPADWSFPLRVGPQGPPDGNGEVRLNLADLGWSAVEVVLGASGDRAAPLLGELLRTAEIAGPAPAGLTEEGQSRYSELTALCGRLRDVLTAATPLLASHLDPAQPGGWGDAELGELLGRTTAWLDRAVGADGPVGQLRERLAALRGVPPELRPQTAEETAAALRAVGDLGVVSARIAGDAADDIAALTGRADNVLACLDAALPALTLSREEDRPTEAWADSAGRAVKSLFGDAMILLPALDLPADGDAARSLTPEARPHHADGPAVTDDEVHDWLRGVHQVRPRARTLGEALTASGVLTVSPVPRTILAQTPARGGTWAATAPAAQGPSAPVCTVLYSDDEPALGQLLAGFLTDTWTETVPFDGKAADLTDDADDTGNQPHEVVGVALHFDRPDARPPQALLLAVSPNPNRGWRAADLQAIVEDTLELARLRALDLHDQPGIRQLLPLPVPDLPTPPA